jgi:hypothetical protein
MKAHFHPASTGPKKELNETRWTHQNQYLLLPLIFTHQSLTVTVCKLKDITKLLAGFLEFFTY